MALAIIAIVAVVAIVGVVAVFKLTRKKEQPKPEPEVEFIRPLPEGYEVAFERNDDFPDGHAEAWDAWILDPEGNPVEASTLWGPTAEKAAADAVKNFNKQLDFRDEGDIAAERISVLFTQRDDIQDKLNRK